MGKAIPIEDLRPSHATSDTCVLVPYDRHRSSFRSAVRAAWKHGSDVDVVAIVPRRAPLLRFLLGRRRDGRHLVVSSPEPTRHGLSVGRAVTCWEKIITGGSLHLLPPSDWRALRDLADSNADAGLIGLSAISTVSGLVTRINSDLVVVQRLAVNLAHGVDESVTSMQDMVDELAGRFTRASIPLAALRRSAHPPEPPIDVVVQRYPWLGIDDRLEPPRRLRTDARADTIGTARQSQQLDVLLDMTAVRKAANGTGQHALRTLRAITPSKELRITTLQDTSTDQQVLQECQRLGVECISLDDSHGREFDVALRPHQFETISEVDQLRVLANRIVVSQLDFIAIDNPTYHPDPASWLRHRSEALGALKAVDGVAWLSQSIREQAILYGFDDAHVPNRVCGSVIETERASSPTGGPPVSGPYVATLGASYQHKGRLYALRLFERLLHSGWEGRMVLAGWDPPHGSSRSDEDALIDTSRALRDSLVRLGTLSPSEQVAAITGATALLQPSVSEGFGLLPGEAAVHGVPTLMLQRSSLREVYPADYRWWITGDDLERDTQMLRNLVSESSDSRMASAELLLGVGDPDRYSADLVELLKEVATR